MDASNIDTEFKAYLLGWLASDSGEIPEHLETRRNDVRKIKTFPKLENDELYWSFIRGVFDGDGHVYKDCRRCDISSNSFEMLKGVSDFCKIENVLSDTTISFYGTNSVDFLSKIYDTSNESLRLSTKYNLYLDQIFNCRPRCKFVKTRADAISPTKLRCSDEGYDLWLVDVDKEISNNTIRYDTFLKIQPEEGWHVEILPRSSLSNSGYILSNCVGLIDSSYRGTLKIALTKLDETADDIKLPFKAVQMVLRRNVHFICEEVDALDATERGDGGFGSTDLVRHA
jgi:deoxyuridine 5'-triphosphate nucleotidohydrolase